MWKDRGLVHQILKLQSVDDTSYVPHLSYSTNHCTYVQKHANQNKGLTPHYQPRFICQLCQDLSPCTVRICHFQKVAFVSNARNKKIPSKFMEVCESDIFLTGQPHCSYHKLVCTVKKFWQRPNYMNIYAHEKHRVAIFLLSIW